MKRPLKSNAIMAAVQMARRESLITHDLRNATDKELAWLRSNNEKRLAIAADLLRDIELELARRVTHGG